MWGGWGGGGEATIPNATLDVTSRNDFCGVGRGEAIIPNATLDVTSVTDFCVGRSEPSQ